MRRSAKSPQQQILHLKDKENERCLVARRFVGVPKYEAKPRGGFVRESFAALF
jgi:hypothetical protein